MLRRMLILRKKTEEQTEVILAMPSHFVQGMKVEILWWARFYVEFWVGSRERAMSSAR